MTDRQKEPGKTNSKAIWGPPIVLLVLAGIVGLFLLVHHLAKGETKGTMRLEGAASEGWSMEVDRCHTRRDIEPVRADEAAIRSYLTREFGTEADTDHYLRVMRNTQRDWFDDDEMVVGQGPNESPSADDEQALSRFRAEQWHIQLQNGKEAIDITPDMCSVFSIHVSLHPKYHTDDGHMRLECELPDGSTLHADIVYERCT